ncbi:hypothetical protein HRI_001997100 [Hibiscus trionum]|uniref:Uncharacterized protein n=1 Tax=Hibiscus trionum TaxID=183268 RepID=A0A9W7HTM9_HIBTR|nr:hypothetical protein HRI_001997100 [Hibiscus trionum]
MDIRMERRKSAATKPRRKAGNKRKPLIDLSNTIPSSQPSSQSSSSSIKFKPQIRSSLSLALKSLPNNPNSNLNNNNEKKENRKSPTNKANPSFSLSPSSQTPFVSVYGRQHTAEKRKSKGKEIAEPLSCIFETRIPDLRKKKDGDGDNDISKSCPMPHKKKQRQVKAEINASKHELAQDFIDKQRAYFAEIDAFELEEEVASGNESS